MFLSNACQFKFIKCTLVAFVQDKQGMLVDCITIQTAISTSTTIDAHTAAFYNFDLMCSLYVL